MQCCSYCEDSQKHNDIINQYRISVFCVKGLKDIDRDGEVCGGTVFRTERYESI